MRPILFLLKLFNDIDQHAPVIWKMASKGYPVRVIFLDKNANIDIRENPHLRRLATFSNCRVDYYYALPESHFRLPNAPLLKSTNPFFVKLLRLFLAFMRTFVWTPAWVDRMLKRISPSICAADCEIPMKRTFEERWLKAIKANRIPLLGLAHSPNAYSNFDFNDKSISKPIRETRVVWKEREVFDYLILNSAYEKQQWLDQKFENPEKLIVLGCPRFCPEWMEINAGLVRDYQPKKTTDSRLKVVFFMPHFGAHVDQVGTIRAIEALAKLDFVHLVIKEQTREGAGHFTLEQRDRFSQNPHVEIIESQRVMGTAEWVRKGFVARDDFRIESSVALIRWCDVAISYSSSIGIEVIAQRKPLLNPVYLYTYASMYEAFGVCVPAYSESEIINIIKNYYENTSIAAYDTRRFEEAIIFGGKGSHDVLSAYEHLFIQLSNGVKLTQAEARATMNFANNR